MISSLLLADIARLHGPHVLVQILTAALLRRGVPLSRASRLACAWGRMAQESGAGAGR